MAQFARPDSDVSNAGAWTTAPLWSKVDETVASDADLITSAVGPVNAMCELGLSDVTDPRVGTGHIWRVRAQRTGGVFDVAYTLKVDLMEGATVRATQTHSIGTLATWTDFTRTLTAGEADAITDYANLRVRLTADDAGSLLSDSVRVSFAELEVPDAPSTVPSYGGLAPYRYGLYVRGRRR